MGACPQPGLTRLLYHKFPCLSTSPARHSNDVTPTTSDNMMLNYEIIAERTRFVSGQSDLETPENALSATSIARASPAALLTVSSYSASATESATIPPAACTW